MFHVSGDEPLDDRPPVARYGSADPALGEELLSVSVELPWDDWLGAGASDRVRDGSLGVVRHAWPATAAHDMRAAATAAGMLQGDAAARERLGAVALAVAAAHHRPARMPHPPGSEPHAWWIDAERTLVWMPWAGPGEEPYGLALLESGEATAVTVTGPDACWTVFRTGLPSRGAAGRFADLPERFRAALLARTGLAATELTARGRWRREGDSIVLRWREGARVRSASLAVNRRRPGE